MYSTVKFTMTTCIWFLLATIIYATPAVAETSPDRIEGSTLVNSEGFIELVEKTPDLLVIDSRIPGDRKQGYVEGSISLPDVDTNCDSLANVIPTKESPALF